MSAPIGKMRDKVTIRKPTFGKDAAGGEQATYTDVGTAFCWIKPLRGRELVSAQQVDSEVTHQIIGHYSSLKDVDASYVIHDARTGRDYEVQVPLPGDQRDQCVLLSIYRPND